MINTSSVSNAMIYLDHPATSWPKPPEVAAAMLHFLQEVGANPGRSGHRLSVEAARIVFAAREAVAELFGCEDALRVVFGANVTWALNQALHGYLRAGDHVITSGMEHNSMMRPLRDLERQGVEVSVVPCDHDGRLDPQRVEDALRDNTVMVALNHASNVSGTILPVREVGEITRRRGIVLLVDAAQTGGTLPLDMRRDQIDLLAFTGHKGLLGPMGTGGLILGERVDLERLRPVLQGGTGSRSESEIHPDFLPDCFESGTPNGVGLAGLNAGVRVVLARGVEAIRAHEQQLCDQLLAGLQQIRRARLYGPLDPGERVAVVSFNLEGLEPSQVGLRLDEEFNILCRVGLHCSPAAHRSLGSLPRGTVRFGIGFYSSAEEVNAALRAVERIAND